MLQALVYISLVLMALITLALMPSAKPPQPHYVQVQPGHWQDVRSGYLD